jgi:hypothetical protein
MAVVVLPEVDAELRESQSLLIEVRSDDDRLPSAMMALRQAIVRLEGQSDDGELERPAFVSQPVPLPGAQLLQVDFGSLPNEPVLSVPRLLARELQDGGVRDAVVAVARHGRLAIVEGFGPAARAYLRGPLSALSPEAPPAPPLALLDVAVEWLNVQRRPGDELSGFVIGVETPLIPASIRSVATAILSTPPPAAGVTLVASDFASQLAAGSVNGSYHNAVPVASLTAAGRQWTAAELAEGMRRLRELIRTHADALVWAGIDTEVDTRRTLYARWEQRASAGQVAMPRRPDVEHLADVLVPDAMWYQILSAGHLDRLGGRPVGAAPLTAGTVELTIGEPEQWTPGHPDGDAVRARGRELLAGCLVSEPEAFTMTAATRAHRRPRPSQ